MATSKISYRRAIFTDFESVMDINRNVYGGLDYLMYRFHSYIADPFRFPFVAIADGAIVGFQCNYVIDNGLSIVSEAARIHPDLQGRGIMSKLDEASLREARTRFPHIKRQMWTTRDMERSMVAVRKANSPIKLLVMRPRVSFDSTCSNLAALCSSPHFLELLNQHKAHVIRAIPRHQAIELLTHNTDFSGVAPCGTLLVNFGPWGLHQSTFIELLDVSTLHITPPDNAPSRSTASGKVDCFSFHSELTMGVGIRCRVDFYCPPGELLYQQAVGHLLYHIRELATCKQNNKVSFSILFPEYIDKAVLKKVLTDDLRLFNTVSSESTWLILGLNLPNGQPKL